MAEYHAFVKAVMYHPDRIDALRQLLDRGMQEYARMLAHPLSHSNRAGNEAHTALQWQ